MSPRALVTLAIIALLLVLAVALRLMVGGSLAGEAGDVRSSIMSLRASRAASGVIVGASLGAAGVLLQALLRNPLASPDLLGLSTGAGLGVTLAIYLGYLARGVMEQGSALTIPALLGSLAALAVVYALSQRRGLLEPVSLILVGVIVSIMLGAAAQMVQGLMPDRGQGVARWMLGAIRDDAPPPILWITSGVTLLAIGMGLAVGPMLDAASLDDDEARSVGVPLAPLRTALLILSGALAAGSVLLAGPIGFVGLVCPHVVRLGAGPAHRTLVAGAAMAGAAMVVLADAAIKALPLATGRPPIGVLTAVIGGPVFILLLRRELAGRH
jgi:iron complex transport system permease protein